MRKMTRKVGGARCFGGLRSADIPISRSPAASWSCYLESARVGKNLPAKCEADPQSEGGAASCFGAGQCAEDDPQSERATRKVGGVRCFLRGKSVRRPAMYGGEVFFGVGFIAVPSSRRPVVLLARLPGVLRRSQSFPVIPSQ